MPERDTDAVGTTRDSATLASDRLGPPTKTVATDPSKPFPRLSPRVTKLVLVLAGALGLGVLAVAMSLPYVFRVGRVEGHAMAPTLRDQDRIIVNGMSYYSKRPQRGDIVMMRYPVDPERLFVKRVIAQPGDRLHIREGRAYVNGQPEDDSYVEPAFRGAGNWGPEVVPEGYYFVMGDRRNNSSDSRHWGYLPAGYVVGRVALRWWPIAEARLF